MNVRRAAAAAVAAIFFSASVSPAAGAQKDKASPYVVQMVTGAAKRGGWLHLTMRDKRVFKGQIIEAATDTFMIQLDGTATVEALRYVDVKKVKGPPTSACVKIAVSAAAIFGAILLIPRILPRT